MPEYLETTVDKFTFRVAKDRLYTPQGAWVFWMKPEAVNRVRIGLADYLQQRSGDVAFATVQPVGTKLVAGERLAEIETIKAMVELPSPVSGTVAEVNPVLQTTPEFINQDPYDKGWLAVIETTAWEAERAKLLEPGAYFPAMQAAAQEVERAMNADKTRVIVVPCSGIGKPFGTVSREAAYELCEELRPETTRLVALAKLVLGDATARELVARHPAVTIDGCKQMCASKMVKQSGGTVAHEVAVLDVFRRHKDLKPEGIAELNEAGQKLARVLAEEVAASLDDTDKPVKGASHV